MATTTTTRPSPSPKPYDLEVTILSAKHLKNVNWKTGDLKPYVIIWVDPDRRQATKPDDYGSTGPIWNERFVFPITLSPNDSTPLNLEIFHSKPSETPKPLVGTARFEIRDLVDEPGSRIRNLELRRPSGRPQGKVKVKMCLIEREIENYHSAPQPYYSYRGYAYPPSSPSPPPPPQPYYSYLDPQSGYYSSGYYSQPPPLPPQPRTFYEREVSYCGPGPSAPVDYTPYDYHKRGGGRSGMGVGTGLGVGAVTGMLGGMALEEGGNNNKYEEERIAERVENNDVGGGTRGDRFGGYQSDY